MAGSTLGNIEKIAGQHIRNLIIKSVTPVLKTLKSGTAANETLEDFKEEYGALGKKRHILSVSSV